jgi:hypothetical protein
MCYHQSVAAIVESVGHANEEGRPPVLDCGTIMDFIKINSIIDDSSCDYVWLSF